MTFLSQIRPAFIVPERALAHHDIDEFIAHHLGESAEQAAYSPSDVLEEAYAHMGRHAATGSPRYAHELNRPVCALGP